MLSMLKTRLAVLLGAALLCAGAPALAQTKITSLPAATTPLAGTEAVPCVQSGITKQCATANFGAPHVATNAALEALSAGKYTTVIRDGFAAAGDAPPLTFTWHGTWSGTPDNLGYVIAPAGAGTCASGCWVASGNGRDFNILEFAGNAATDYGAPCTAAFAALQSNVGGSINFPSGLTYPFTTSCNIGTALTGGSVTDVWLNDATLTTSAAIHMFDRTPTSSSQANTIVDAVINFHGGLLKGASLAGSIGINLGATYSGYTIGTQIQNFDVGIYCQFCLDYRIQSVRTTSNKTYGIVLGPGLWTGGSGQQSNASTIENSRDYASAGETASFAVLASDGVRLNDVISEGSAPVQEIYFSDQSQSTVKQLIIDNVHAENNPSGAIITLAGTGGETFDISHVFAQYAAPLVDTTGITTAATSFHIRDIPYSPWGTGVIFAGNGPGGSIWLVDNFYQSVDVTATTHWSTGTVPALFVIGRWPNNGAGMQFSQMNAGSATTTTSVWNMNAKIQFPTDDTYNIGNNATAYRPHSVFVGTGGVSSYGGFSSSGSAGVTCTGAPTVNFATVGGIVTHC